MPGSRNISISVDGYVPFISCDEVARICSVPAVYYLYDNEGSFAFNLTADEFLNHYNISNYKWEIEDPIRKNNTMNDLVIFCNRGSHHERIVFANWKKTELEKIRKVVKIPYRVSTPVNQYMLTMNELKRYIQNRADEMSTV